MGRFEVKYEEWLMQQIKQEDNPRRRELLEKGLGHGTVEFLRHIWFPSVGNFDHLYPEWEVRDFNSGYRYVDLAFMPSGVKGESKFKGTARMRETLILSASKTCAGDTVLWRSTSGCFFLLLIRLLKKNLGAVNNSYSPSSASLFP